MQDKQRLLSHLEKHTDDEYFRKYYGAYMMPIFIQGYFATTGALKHSDLPIKHGMFFQNMRMDREFDWIWNEGEMMETRDRLFAELESDVEFGNKFFNSYITAFEKFDLHVKEEEKYNYQNLSAEELVKRLLDIIEVAGGQCIGYVIDSLLTSSGEDYFEKYFEKYHGKILDKEKMEVLRGLTRRSFVNEVHLQVLELACKKSNGEDIEEGLDKIVQDFYWVENNYIKGEPKTKEAFAAEVEVVKNACEEFKIEKERIDMLKKQKENSLDEINASNLTRAFVKMSDDFAYIQDCRKQTVLRLNHFIFLYMRELAQKIDFDPELILYIMFYELPDLIKDPASFLDIAKDRHAGCLAMFDKEGCAIFTRKDLEQIDLSNFYKDYSEVVEAKGQPASPGNVRGVARVILGSDQFAELQDGDILITNQTTPDFVPIMKKSKAIVAEQGGVTSHAAIVSRELGIPCVVGVKGAMQIFKSGEEVEVDAVKGIVRKLN